MAEFVSPLDESDRRVLNDLHARAYGVPRLLGCEGNVYRFGHASEDAALSNVAANRTVYGYEAGVEQIDGQWQTWVDISSALAIYSARCADPIAYRTSSPT